MKTRNKLIAGIITLAVTGILIELARIQRNNKQLARISDEGYEFAADILFPVKPGRKKFR